MLTFVEAHPIWFTLWFGMACVTLVICVEAIGFGRRK